jgi:hypothetical protein
MLADEPHLAATGAGHEARERASERIAARLVDVVHHDDAAPRARDDRGEEARCERVLVGVILVAEARRRRLARERRGDRRAEVRVEERRVVVARVDAVPRAFAPRRADVARDEGGLAAARGTREPARRRCDPAQGRERSRPRDRGIHGWRDGLERDHLRGLTSTSALDDGLAGYGPPEAASRYDFVARVAMIPIPAGFVARLPHDRTCSR